MNINEVEWFKNIGVASAELPISIPIKFVASEAECFKNINSLKWGNFILYAMNRLSWYLQTFHKEESKRWNEIAKEANAVYGSFKDRAQHAVQSKNLPEEAILDIRFIFVPYYIEQFYLGAVGTTIPCHFDKIMDIYFDGHIPCGWDGILPQNEGYDPIDLNAGKILVW